MWPIHPILKTYLYNEHTALTGHLKALQFAKPTLLWKRIQKGGPTPATLSTRDNSDARNPRNTHQHQHSVHNNYESFYKGLILINPELRQIFHLLIYLLTYSFISIQHRGKIFPKKEIKIKVVDFAWLITNLQKSCDLLHFWLSYSCFKFKICKSVAFKSVFWFFLAE